LRNLNGMRFEDVSASAGAAIVTPEAHRGMAYGDLNNDGRMDAVVTVKDGPPEILINRSTNSNHWLLVKLVGARSNRDGLGARLKAALPDGRTLYNQATTSTGLGASSDSRVHFGLGAAAQVARLEVDWPSGIRQVLENVAADRILTVHEPPK